MIRVVFDTNVLFSAALKRTGVPAQTLDLVADRILSPCVSNAVMAEYFEVLTRSVLHLHAARVRELLAVMAKFAEHVSPAQNFPCALILTTTAFWNAH
jgi:putative PIN family toxin of toxin-antitoxin system